MSTSSLRPVRTPPPASEGELFYRAALTPLLSVGVNYQPLFNPAYNRDRGPVHIFTGRVHVAF